MDPRCGNRGGASCWNGWGPSSRIEERLKELQGLEPVKKATADRVFHALGDPTRRSIMERLSAGPMSVSRLAEPLSITVAAVVQHLQILEESRLVQTEKIGRVRTCRIEPAGLDIAQQWINQRRIAWERRLDRLGDLLAEPDSE